MKLKRLSLSLGAIFLLAATPFINIPAADAGIKEIKDAVMNAITRPNIKLNLSVAKQVIQKQKNGRKAIVWQKLSDNTKVQPGLTIRYQVLGKNEGNANAKNLVITQPIDPQTSLKLGSVKSTLEAEVTYSINNGKSFVENPTVQVKLPSGDIEEVTAPAESYTHIRWKFSQDIEPQKEVKASYLATVR